MEKRSYVYIYLLVRWIYCSEYEQFYTRSLDQRMYTNTLLGRIKASSRIMCASWCQITPSCQDFTFHQNGCKVYGVEGSAQPFKRIELFVKDKANFTATQLPSGDLFTYVFMLSKTPHDMAKSGCKTLGSRLVQIDTVEKLEQLRSAIKEHPELVQSYWLDGYRERNLQSTSYVDWHFSNGEMIPAEVWSDGFPDSHFSQCIHLWDGAGFILDDIYCENSERGFICEK